MHTNIHMYIYTDTFCMRTDCCPLIAVRATMTVAVAFPASWRVLMECDCMQVNACAFIVRVCVSGEILSGCGWGSSWRSREGDGGRRIAHLASATDGHNHLPSYPPTPTPITLHIHTSTHTHHSPVPSSMPSHSHTHKWGNFYTLIQTAVMPELDCLNWSSWQRQLASIRVRKSHVTLLVIQTNIHGKKVFAFLHTVCRYHYASSALMLFQEFHQRGRQIEIKR